MCFLFPVNSSAKQFLDKIYATFIPLLWKRYSTFLLPSLVEKLWADVEIQLGYKEKKRFPFNL